MPSRSTFSLDKLKEYVGDDPQQVKEMLQIFLDTVPDDVEQMNLYFQEKNWPELYKLAHRTKPTFKVFEMDDIYSEIKIIEAIAMQNNIDNNIHNHFSRFVASFEVLKDIIEYELSAFK